MKTYLVITALLVGLFGLTSCGETDTPEPSATPSADLKKVSERWSRDMTQDERDAVCAALRTTPSQEYTDPGSGQLPYSGPNYKAMLDAIMDAGFSQPEAAAMIPYAVNKCV